MNELIQIFLTPDYKIYCLFKINDYTVYLCDLNDFINKQNAINAPGKELIDLNIWFTCKIKLYRIEWINGVSLSYDYLLNNGKIVDNYIIKN